jgi:hypothetical protein
MRTRLVVGLAVLLCACKGGAGSITELPAPRSSSVPVAAASARLPGAEPALPSRPAAGGDDLPKVNLVLLEARERFRRCHERSASSATAGTVELTLSVDASGKVRSVATTTTFATPDVATCVERTVRTLEFPALGGPVSLVVPLEFAPAASPTQL